MNTTLTIEQIQCAVADVFGVRTNIIVPNVSWGFFATHEADMVVINKSGYLIEVEIKRSWEDFKKDFQKTTTHDEGKVQWKFFAVPASLKEKVLEYLAVNQRNDWGVIIYYEDGSAWYEKYPNRYGNPNPKNKLFLEEKLAIARLGCMRIWGLKKKLTDNSTRNKNNQYRFT